MFLQCYETINVFLPVNATQFGLECMFAGFLLVSNVERFFLPCALAAHLLYDFVNCKPTPMKMTNTAPLTSSKPIHFSHWSIELYLRFEYG
jgi:hypothetical protein